MGSSNTGAKDESETDSGDAKTVSRSDSQLFAEGEKVYAHHHSCLYEAKVLKVEISEKEQKYFVHYLGWNKSWDEWVGADRLLKFTDENAKKQKELNKKQGAEKNFKSGGRSTQTKPKSSNEAKAEKDDPRNHAGKSKKRKVESGIEEKDIISTDKLVKIHIPSTLKKQLLQDCEYVTQLGKLVKLPRDPCVDDILNKYLDNKSKKDATIVDSVGEIVKGLRCYFDKAILTMLLYKNEKEQYRELILDNISPSTVYGAEHLLRLFVKLPEILSSASLDADTLNQLLQILHDFLKFLQKNQGTFFSIYDVSKGVEASINEEDE